MMLNVWKSMKMKTNKKEILSSVTGNLNDIASVILILGSQNAHYHFKKTVLILNLLHMADTSHK